MEEMSVRATRQQVESLKESLLWDDILRELEVWKIGFEREMMSIVDNAEEDSPSTASVLMHIGDIHGRVKAVDYMASILDVFLETIEIQKEEKENEREED